MNNVIETHGLKRSFGKVDAVDNLTLTVPEGSIYAFLGPNGAGKTTTIKMLMNILEPTAGSASVLGVNSTSLGRREFMQIGGIAVEFGHADALETAANILRTANRDDYLSEAREALRKFTPSRDDQALLAWYDANRNKLVFDAQSKKFIVKP